MRLCVLLGPFAPTREAETWDFDQTDIFFRPVVRAIQDCIGGRPVERTYSYLPLAEFLHDPKTADFDGWIILSTESDDLVHMLDAPSRLPPYCIVGTSSLDPRFTSLPCIDAANYDGGRIAARHLIDLGHRRVACVNLAMSFSNHADRMRGFEDELATAGIFMDPTHIVLERGYAWSRFHEIMKAWINSIAFISHPPTAVFACDFNMAEATAVVLEQHGIAIPDQVSLIGFDDPPFAERFVPPLTTIRQPAYAMGYRAAQRVLAALADPDHPQPVVGLEVVPTELILRQSTAPPLTR